VCFPFASVSDFVNDALAMRDTVARTVVPSMAPG
jgi:hypothetical protein